MAFRYFLVVLAAMLMATVNAAASYAHPPAQHDPAPAEAQVAADPSPAEDPVATSQNQAPAAGVEHRHEEVDPCAAEDDHHAEGSGGQAPGGPGHAHWGADGASTPIERSMARIGVFHAVAVHFPIALILAAALAQMFVLMGRFTNGADTVRFLVWTGVLGGIGAGLLGWAHSGPMAANEVGVMLAHRVIGTSLITGLAILAGLAEWHHRASSAASMMVLSAALFTSAAALAVNAFLGGALAHGGMRHLIGGG